MVCSFDEPSEVVSCHEDDSCPRNYFSLFKFLIHTYTYVCIFLPCLTGQFNLNQLSLFVLGLLFDGDETDFYHHHLKNQDLVICTKKVMEANHSAIIFTSYNLAVVNSKILC